MPYAAVARARMSSARPTVAMSAQDFVASSVNFDGHFVMSESRWPT
jgi:hypothetical protein